MIFWSAASSLVRVFSQSSDIHSEFVDESLAEKVEDERQVFFDGVSGFIGGVLGTGDFGQFAQIELDIGGEFFAGDFETVPESLNHFVGAEERVRAAAGAFGLVASEVSSHAAQGVLVASEQIDELIGDVGHA